MPENKIDTAEVPRWNPRITLSEHVSESAATKGLRDRAPARIRPPHIVFETARPMLLASGSFACIGEAGGLVEESTYLFDHYRWRDVFSGSSAVVCIDDDRPCVVAGNAAWSNYYHWTFQCLTPILLAQAAGLDTSFRALVPPLDTIRRTSLELAGLISGNMVELHPGSVALPARAIRSNLLGGDFAFEPHPEIVRAISRIGESVPLSPYAGRRIYVARTDARQRRMTNEPDLVAKLRDRGFAIVEAGRLSLPSQIALFRDADMIVAPHGAALTNLLYAKFGAGPVVLELMQENYLARAFLKICQVQGLDYHAIINPMTDPGADGRHDSTWRADIPLIMNAIDEGG